MAPRKPPETRDVTPEQEALLEKLARREHEEREAETRLLDRLGRRAEVAKQLWTAIIGLIVFSCAATVWVITLKLTVDRNVSDVEHNRTDIQENRKILEQLRLDMKDKADKPK